MVFERGVVRVHRDEEHSLLGRLARSERSTSGVCGVVGKFTCEGWWGKCAEWEWIWSGNGIWGRQGEGGGCRVLCVPL